MKKLHENTERIQTRIGDLWIEDGILFFYTKSNIYINKEMTKVLPPIFEELCGNNRYPILLHTGRNNKLDQDAREFIASEFRKYRSAEAIICESFYHRLIAQLYISVNRPGNPVKIFNKAEDGLSWLRSLYI